MYSLPVVLNYDLHFIIEPTNKNMQVEGLITFKNDTPSEIEEIPFVLYHHLEVKNITSNEQNLAFKQTKIELKGELPLPVTYILIKKTMKKDEVNTIHISYSGSLDGYEEFMFYVKDKIDPEFTYIRPDCYAYPILASDSFESTLKAFGRPYQYNVEITVPSAYNVACGGNLIEQNLGEKNTYLFSGNGRRMDICISRYDHLVYEEDYIKIDAFKKDTLFAETRMMDEIRRVLQFYEDKFGKYGNKEYFKIIEVKEQYGSGIGTDYITMEEHGFEEGSALTHLYHELGHIWNVEAEYHTERTRFFDEAFACFYEALAIKLFYGENLFLEKMEEYRKGFKDAVKQDELFYKTPIASYGKKEIGFLSYLKGPWALYVLFLLIGENTFYHLVKTFLQNFKHQKVNFSDFFKLCKQVSKVNLDTYINDWFYTDTSSHYLVSDLSGEMMAIKARNIS